jgi:hypothetical protein
VDHPHEANTDDANPDHYRGSLENRYLRMSMRCEASCTAQIHGEKSVHWRGNPRKDAANVGVILPWFRSRGKGIVPACQFARK